jgi:hypothetical protein
MKSWHTPHEISSPNAVCFESPEREMTAEISKFVILHCSRAARRVLLANAALRSHI